MLVKYWQIGSDSSLVGEASNRGLTSKASRARVKIKMSWACIIRAWDEVQVEARDPYLTLYLSSSNRWIMSDLQVREATWGTRRYLNACRIHIHMQCKSAKSLSFKTQKVSFSLKHFWQLCRLAHFKSFVNLKGKLLSNNSIDFGEKTINYAKGLWYFLFNARTGPKGIQNFGITFIPAWGVSQIFSKAFGSYLRLLTSISNMGNDQQL